MHFPYFLSNLSAHPYTKLLKTYSSGGILLCPYTEKKQESDIQLSPTFSTIEKCILSHRSTFFVLLAGGYLAQLLFGRPIFQRDAHACFAKVVFQHDQFHLPRLLS